MARKSKNNKTKESFDFKKFLLTFLSKYQNILGCSAVIILALILRLQGSDFTLNKHDGNKQIYSLQVIRNLSQNLDVLHPSIAGITDTSDTAYFAEFPLYQFLVALWYRYIPFGAATLETYAMLVSIFFSVVLTAIIFNLGLREYNRIVAYSSAIFYAIMPYVLLQSSMVMSDVVAITLAFLSLLLMHYFTSSNSLVKRILFYLGTLIFLSFSCLMRPLLFVFLIPIIFLFVRIYKFDVFKKIQFYLFLFLVTLPSGLWFYHIVQNGGSLPGLPTATADFPTIVSALVFEKLAITVLGVFLSFFVLIAYVHRQDKYLYWVIFTSFMIILLLFEEVFYEANYHFAMIIPSVALMFGLGFKLIVVDLLKQQFNIFATLVILIFVLVSGYYISYQKVSKNKENSLKSDYQIAEIIKDVVNKDQFLITDTHGDAFLLYLTGLSGSPKFDYHNLPNKQRIVLYTSNQDLIKSLKSQDLEVKMENKQFAIIKLDKSLMQK